MNTFQGKAGMLRSQRIIAMNIQPKITPVLDPGFVPAVLWNQAFEAKAAADPTVRPGSSPPVDDVQLSRKPMPSPPDIA